MAFGGETAESYYDEGLTATMRGDYAQAIEHLERAIELDRHLYAAHHQLGKCYLRLGDFEKAVQLLKHVVAAKPAQLPARIDLGYALQEAGQPEQAERVFNEVVNVKPDNARAQLGLAYCAFDRGQWDDAMHLAQAAAMQGGANFSAFYLLGRAAKLCERGDIANEALDRAEKLIQQSIETSPDQPEGYFLRGEIFFARANFAAALDDFRSAEDRAKPDQIYSSYNEHFTRVDMMARRGICLQRLDRKEEAREVGRQILALQADHKIGQALAEG